MIIYQKKNNTTDWLTSIASTKIYYILDAIPCNKLRGLSIPLKNTELVSLSCNEQKVLCFSLQRMVDNTINIVTY